MVVLGQNAFVFESTEWTCNVQPFTYDLGVASNVPIVDGAIAHDCHQTSQTCILISRNALYVPMMDNNLIPPFIMSHGGVTVNDKANINCVDPSEEDHCIMFPECELKIPLQLFGIFLYFHSRLPTVTELHECDKVFITPDSNDWNLNCLSFEQNERSMLDYDNEMSHTERRSDIPMQVEEEAKDIFECASVTAKKWSEAIDTNIKSAFANISYNNKDSRNEDKDFSEALSVRREISKLCASISSCSIANDNV